MKAVLGIDTSCYTTSVALASGGFVLGQARRLLTVPEGERGLRQSDGLFQHVNRLPDLVEGLMREHPEAEICAVCYSARPRPVEGSYMPVFTAGECCARSIAAAMGVPAIASSHQEGHIRAALVDAGVPEGPFLALHLSGGTSELIRVENKTLTLLGGSCDLNAGQLVDRVGVRLGLPFPAGPEMEKLARRGEAKSALPLTVRGLDIHFSGAEACAMRMIEAGVRPEDMAMEVYSVIARTLAKLFENAANQTGIRRVLLAGGVASSQLLKEVLAERIKKRGIKLSLYWARPELSGDNAAGVALLGEEYMKEREKQ